MQLELSVGRFINENAITIGDRRGWMINTTFQLELPAGSAITISDMTGGKRSSRVALAKDDLRAGHRGTAGQLPRVLFLSQEPDGGFGLRTVIPPDEASALQRELCGHVVALSISPVAGQ